MRLRLLGRASDLAVFQVDLVARALRARWPGMEITQLARTSQGDRDQHGDLAAAVDRGLFTSDLSGALASGEADAAVHSWKDLPTADHPGTIVAATLERADPRDVLIVRRAAVASQPRVLNVLSSSPRRAWQLRSSLGRLLPWPIDDLRVVPVRGNVPTRLARLLEGRGDALVVAKAALDRLLSPGAPSTVRTTVRQAIDGCRWMVLPLREFPTAPAQGALAIEIPAGRTDVAEWVAAVNHAPTWRAVQAERAILAATGGGCHEALGATVLVRDYGQITSIRARAGDGTVREEWSLDAATTPPPRPSSPSLLWPLPHERRFERRPLEHITLPVTGALLVARAEALPDGHRPGEDQVVWAAGSRTWERLAARGVWVHGSTDGLGDTEPAGVDLLAGRSLDWRRLTHSRSGAPDAVATYVVDTDLPVDLDRRTHFFWTSGSLFVEALRRHPALRGAWHASGPGRTARVLRDALGPDARTSIWLDYQHWHQRMTS